MIKGWDLGIEGTIKILNRRLKAQKLLNLLLCMMIHHYNAHT